MKKTILVVASLVLAFGSALAQNGVVQISQATITATGVNRATAGFPYQITQPGSYQLTSNLTVPIAVDGIDILANNVTLDLNGFTISGLGQCAGSGSNLYCEIIGSPDGISSSGANVTVRNGSVGGFYDGVLLNCQGGLVEEIHASGNIHFGINIANGVVRRSTANLNSAGGIKAQSSTVTENVANFNGYSALSTSDGGVYGSNTFFGTGNPPVNNTGSVSQNNNACGSASC